MPLESANNSLDNFNMGLFVKNIGPYSLYSDGTEIPYIEESPATGPIKLREDSIYNTAISLVNMSGDWTKPIEGKFEPFESASADAYMVLSPNITDWGFHIYRDAANSVRFKIRDDSNVTRFEYSMATTGAPIEFKMTRVSGVNELFINGSSVLSQTTDLTTNGFTVTNVAFGAKTDTSSKSNCDWYWFKSDIDDWDFETRLPIELDANGDKFIGTVNSTVLTLIDNSPEGAYYPNIGKWPAYYLESDHP